MSYALGANPPPRTTLAEMARARANSHCEDIVGGHYIRSPDYRGTHPGYCVPTSVQWTTQAEAEAASRELNRLHEGRLHEQGVEARRAARRDPKQWVRSTIYMAIVFWPVTLGLVTVFAGAWWYGRRNR